jgi:hypothetical protein
LGRGENILQAHRSHLYQRLVIAGQTHRRVTLVYGKRPAGVHCSDLDVAVFGKAVAA